MLYENGNYPQSIKPGISLIYEEDVFVKNNEKMMLAGKRKIIAEVLEKSIQGCFIVKIIKSKGYNAFPAGVKITKPEGNLLRAFIIEQEHLDKINFKSGGHLEGTDASGKKITLDNAAKGGMGIGSSHANGGIKAKVGTEERPIEFEGNEIILTKAVSDDTRQYDFNGKKMTAKQVASQLNVDNGGVAFADGGEVPDKIKCSGKRYNFSGADMADHEIATQLCGCNH